MKDITLISLSDESYYPYLKVLVKSAVKNFPQANLFVVLVNMDEKYKKEIEGLSPGIRVEMEKVSFPGEHEKRCYCASRRAFLFKKLREETDDILLWVDADSIIRKSCDGLIQHLNSCELTMRSKSKGRFASGVIGVDSSDICNEFIEEYYNEVSKHSDWMNDQKSLHTVYLKFQDRIKFRYLERTYCEVSLTEDAVIWAAKSHRKNSKKYISEMRKYD